MSRSDPYHFLRPVLWALGLLLVIGLVVSGLVAVVWSGFRAPDVEAERTATAAIVPVTATEGEVTVHLDAAARPVDGNSPDHIGVQPFIDLDQSDFRGSVLVTLEPQGTESGPIEPAGDRNVGGWGSDGDRALTAWSTARATSVQQVVDPGSGRLGLGSVRVVFACPLGEACTARWRYRFEPLGSDSSHAKVVWGVRARAVYSIGDRARRAPEGATMDVTIGDAESVAPSPEPVVLAAGGLRDSSTITVRGPAGTEGIVRAVLLDGANGTAPDFFLSPAGDRSSSSVATVGPSIWEAPLVAGTCDASGCTVQLRVVGTPPSGSTLRVDARADAPLGAPAIGDQVVVAVE